MVLFGALVLTLLIQTIGEIDFIEELLESEEEHAEEQRLKSLRFKEATKFSSRDDTAYVFLGLGATAHQMNCPAAIESLVRFAGWDGKVYLITDQASCFDRDLMIRNAGMKAENLNIVEVKEDFGGGGVDLSNPKVGFSKNRLKSKSMKTQLFDVIPDPSVQVLAYADCDILFVDEGCATEFVTGGVPWEDKKIRFSRVTVDTESGRLANIHTGTILMHRQHSKEVLQRWSDRLNSGVDDMDRPAYLIEYHAVQAEIDARTAMAALHSANNSRGHNSTHAHTYESHYRPDFANKYVKYPAVAVDPAVRTNLRKGGDATITGSDTSGRGIFFPLDPLSTRNVMYPSERVRYNDSTGNATHFELFVNPQSEQHSCMVHVSKARCDLFGRDAVQKYVDRFNLRTYSQGYKYCPNPVVAPMLYGWFPLSYLPYCPKIELFY